MDEFIDLCILCGCDYTCTIKGIGPGRSIKMIKKHRSIEQAVKFLDPAKHQISPDFQFKEAAVLFKTPDCTPPDEVKMEWKPADEEGIIQFLVTEKGFNKERIESGLKRIKPPRAKAPSSAWRPSLVQSTWCDTRRSLNQKRRKAKGQLPQKEQQQPQRTKVGNRRSMPLLLKNLKSSKLTCLTIFSKSSSQPPELCPNNRLNMRAWV